MVKHILKGLASKEIKDELDKVYGTSAPAYTIVYNWVHELKRDRASIKGVSRSVCPLEDYPRND